MSVGRSLWRVFLVFTIYQTAVNIAHTGGGAHWFYLFLGILFTLILWFDIRIGPSGKTR